MAPDLLPLSAHPVLWEEEIWDELLAYIEEQRVIPIVGPDLLRMEAEGKEVLLDRYLATQLAGKFAVPADTLPAEPTLNDVVCHLLRRNRRREALYPGTRPFWLWPFPLDRLGMMKVHQDPAP
jgi:hypothetical protein